METVLEKALEIALEKEDPREKLKRRREREAKKKEKEKEKSQNPCPDLGQDREREKQKAGDKSQGSGEEAATGPAKSRYIASEVRERVLERAGYQCEYRGRDGTRCSCRTGLEIEHELPFAVYRSHDERYLRAFCRAHNRLAAEKFYGREFIERRIEERRSNEKASRSRVA